MNNASHQTTAALDDWCMAIANEALPRLLDDEWATPEQDSAKLRNYFLRHLSDEPRNWDVLITGEHSNRTIYLQFPTSVYLISPFQPIEDCVVFEELLEAGKSSDIVPLSRTVCRIAASEYLHQRLRLPKVLLINMTSPHFAHTPSVALGVSMVGAMLRKRQKASVRIVDMKLGWSMDDILKIIAEENPDCIGASIDFGEKMPFVELFLRIVAAYDGRNCPLLFAGNYLAYLYAPELIQRFPMLIVNHGEGEQFVLDLVDHHLGKISLEQVSAATYKDTAGLIVHTPLREIAMDQLPLPAGDALPVIVSEKCAFTLELSRGCSYNACTFCPRSHKIRVWKTVTASRAVEWIQALAGIFDKNPHLARRVYLVDEEFIGSSRGGLENERLLAVAKGLLERKPQVAFEFNTRVDQIFNPRKSEAWHIERFKALRLCKQAGLKRILLGIESGSTAALARFRKGHSVSDSVAALRVLSALGIDIRVTFITYDPLMAADDLFENYLYLGRRDALFKELPQGQEDYRALFHSVSDDNYRQEQLTGAPIYEKTCYLHNSMKVLSDSQYAHELSARLSGGQSHSGQLVTIARRQPLEQPTLTPAAPEELNSQYLDPALGIAAEIGEDWMSKANTLTNLLMMPVTDDSREKRQTRARLIGNLQDSAFVLLKVFVYIFCRQRLSFDDLELDLITSRTNREAAGHLRKLQADFCEGRVSVLAAAPGIKEIALQTLSEILKEFRLSHFGAEVSRDEGSTMENIERLEAQLLCWERVNPLA